MGDAAEAILGGEQSATGLLVSFSSTRVELYGTYACNARTFGCRRNSISRAARRTETATYGRCELTGKRIRALRAVACKVFFAKLRGIYTIGAAAQRELRELAYAA